VDIDLEMLRAINASPLPYDLFREAHKGLRRAIFAVTLQAGCADYTDSAARVAMVERVNRLIALLERHHAHEGDYVRPVLDQHAARIGAMVHEGHAEIEASIVELAARVAELAELAGLTDRCGRAGADAVIKGLELYRHLAGFAALYLAHMAFEEGEVMGALRDAMSIGDLYAIELKIRTSVPSTELCEFVTDMAPAINVDERAVLLGGLKATACPELYEQIRLAAEAALTPADYLAVLARIELG
jgi:hypothetical protein